MPDSMEQSIGEGKGESGEVGAEEARKDLTGLMMRAGFGNERIVLTRNGKRTAALIGMRDLERLAALDAAEPATSAA